MSNKEVQEDTVLSDLLKYKKELSRLEQLINKQNELMETEVNNLISNMNSNLESKINSQGTEVKKLKKEINLSKEITEKTKEYFK